MTLKKIAWLGVGALCVAFCCLWMTWTKSVPDVSGNGNGTEEVTPSPNPAPSPSNPAPSSLNPVEQWLKAEHVHVDKLQSN